MQQYRWPPRHRPPVALRVVAALLGIAMLAFNAALMISDRAPSVLRRVFGDSARRLFERIDAGDRVSAITSDPRVPQSDALVHIAVWAVAIGLVGIAVWSWAGLVIGGATVLACSLVVEALQGRLSDTRAVEASDAAANALGVAVGATVVAGCYVMWSTAASVFGRDAREW